MRRNIDCWSPAQSVARKPWSSPRVAAGRCSGLRARSPRDDPHYAAKAGARIRAGPTASGGHGRGSRFHWLESEARPRIAIHSPCTLQHALKLAGVTETMSRPRVQLGPVRILICAAAPRDCFDSARSIVAPAAGGKSEAPGSTAPGTTIATARSLLPAPQAKSASPVKHWIELLDSCAALRT